MLDAPTTDKDFYFRLAAIAFALNWVWEVLQMFAYQTKWEESWRDTALFCTLATIIDVLIILFIFKLVKKFILERGAKFYLATALLGVLSAVVIEIVAVGLGLWSYDATMPQVPLIKVGVLPFLQLMLLTPATVWLSSRAIP